MTIIFTLHFCRCQFRFHKCQGGEVQAREGVLFLDERLVSFHRRRETPEHPVRRKWHPLPPDLKPTQRERDGGNGSEATTEENRGGGMEDWRPGKFVHPGRNECGPRGKRTGKIWRMFGPHSSSGSSSGRGSHYLCEMEKAVLGRRLCVGHNWFRRQAGTNRQWRFLFFVFFACSQRRFDRKRMSGKQCAALGKTRPCVWKQFNRNMLIDETRKGTLEIILKRHQFATHL